MPPQNKCLSIFPMKVFNHDNHVQQQINCEQQQALIFSCNDIYMKQQLKIKEQRTLVTKTTAKEWQKMRKKLKTYNSKK